MQARWKWTAIAVTATVLMACGGGSGTGGSPARVVAASVVEPAGANCPDGGMKLDFGADANGNGALEGAEVQGSAYACTSRLPQGDASCPYGGTSLQIAGLASGAGPQLTACHGRGSDAVQTRYFVPLQIVDNFPLQCDFNIDATCAGNGANFMQFGGGFLADAASVQRICAAMNATGGTIDGTQHLVGNSAAIASWNGTRWEFTSVNQPTIVTRFSCVF
jgi:hypothetical protein